LTKKLLIDSTQKGQQPTVRRKWFIIYWVSLASRKTHHVLKVFLLMTWEIMHHNALMVLGEGLCLGQSELAFWSLIFQRHQWDNLISEDTTWLSNTWKKKPILYALMVISRVSYNLDHTDNLLSMYNYFLCNCYNFFVKGYNKYVQRASSRTTYSCW